MDTGRKSKIRSKPKILDPCVSISCSNLTHHVFFRLISLSATFFVWITPIRKGPMEEDEHVFAQQVRKFD